MRVAILHPWFPQYRAPFFTLLIERLKREEIDCDIFHGAPPPEWRDRNDSVSAPYATLLPTRFIRAGGRHLSIKNLGPLRTRTPYDVIIVEQAVRNLETYRLLAGRTPVAFWGHGKTYTGAVGRRQEALKKFITMRGIWFFAYTQGGADAVASSGFDQTRITVVQNSIDSQSLRSEVKGIAEEETKGFRKVHGLTDKTALYIGGLDSAKRIGFLLEASRSAHAIDRDFRLLVVGAGSESEKVVAAARREGWLTYLGPLFEKEKALAMSASAAIAMPGRVGLAAIDSFASSLPIVTTKWDFHAPEFEYLEDGSNSSISDNTLQCYSAALAEVVSNNTLRRRLVDGCNESYERFSLEAMAANFVKGLRELRLQNGFA